MIPFPLSQRKRPHHEAANLYSSRVDALADLHDPRHAGPAHTLLRGSYASQAIVCQRHFPRLSLRASYAAQRPARSRGSDSAKARPAGVVIAPARAERAASARTLRGSYSAANPPRFVPGHSERRLRRREERHPRYPACSVVDDQKRRSSALLMIGGYAHPRGIMRPHAGASVPRRMFLYFRGYAA